MKVKKLFFILLAAAFATHLNATNNITGAHMFGFSASFNDSTVYITEIQYVDSAYIGKSNFLFSRESYSYQLQNYLRQKGIQHPTCITTFSKEQKNIEKKYLALRKKYTKGGHYNIVYIPASDFRYQAVIPQANDLKKEKEAELKAKEAKKAAKEAKKKAKQKEKMAEKGIIPTEAVNNTPTGK